MPREFLDRASRKPDAGGLMDSMETTTNYRLERWIALILSLLFLLPFLAR